MSSSVGPWIATTSHTRHDTEDVVVGSVDTENSSRSIRGVVENSRVYTGHVKSTRGLVFFWFECERVDRDFCGGYVSVVLVRLNVGEVFTSTFSKSVVTVKLKFGNTSGKVS